ncbi:MAG: hypothetical protein EPN21_17185 [Methylococcaceae bacterium]|nr:MAG: hypothetical protein EPN21_17185 [Methylococcaceae bacterium]
MATRKQSPQPLIPVPHGIDPPATALLWAALWLASPPVTAAPPPTVTAEQAEEESQRAAKAQEIAHLQRQAEAARAEQQRLTRQQEETQRQAQQAAQENAALRQKLDMKEQELARQRAEPAQPKADPALQQRVEQLERQLAEARRQAVQAETAARQAQQAKAELAQEKQRKEQQLAIAQQQAEQARQERRRAEAKLEQPSDVPAPATRSEPPTAALSPSGTAATVGSTIKDCDVCPALVVIPSGEFTMGSPAGETGRSSNEGPQHTVRIGYRLAVGKYEVSFAEWDACAAEGACAKPDDRGWGRGNRPVINVNWNEIRDKYLPWLNRKAHLNDKSPDQQYRLLSEAEWEYAARAGAATAFSFGDNINTDLANYDGNYSYNGGPKGQYRQQTLPVNSFAPNAWGLHNMHGNVLEWVQDCYKDSYQGAPNDGRPVEETGCSRRVLRGGSWVSFPGDLRSAFRGRDAPDDHDNLSGFRLARMLP